MASKIIAGDILVRNGVVGFSGARVSILNEMIGEPYNHAGVALSDTEVHHIESNGYETIPIIQFYACKSANEGAVIRFVGPLSDRIRSRVVNIVRKRRYPKKILGNPFSTSRNRITVNCNEFILGLYKQAILELMEEYIINDQTSFRALVAAYDKKRLIQPRLIKKTLPGVGARRAVSVGESLARTQANHPEVTIDFEGDVGCDISIAKMLCLSSTISLSTYTPNSFISSPFFLLVEERTCNE